MYLVRRPGFGKGLEVVDDEEMKRSREGGGKSKRTSTVSVVADVVVSRVIGIIGIN